MAASGAPRLLGVVRAERAVTITQSDGETREVAPDALPPDLPAAGTEVPAALLERLRAAAVRKRAARRVFELLDRRRWTAARLRARLAAEGFGPEAVEPVLADFAREALVDDRRTAEAFCRDALRARPVGRLWLQARLAAQGVGAAEAAAAIAATLPPEREAELARGAAAARWRRERSGGAAATARVARFLAARGFPPALAGRAAREAAPRGSAPAGGGEREGPEEPA